MHADILDLIFREQILGKEARAKVPDEFVVQHNREIFLNNLEI